MEELQNFYEDYEISEKNLKLLVDFDEIDLKMEKKIFEISDIKYKERKPQNLKRREINTKNYKSRGNKSLF